MSKLSLTPYKLVTGYILKALTAKGGKKLRYDALYEVEYISAKDGSKIISRIGVSADTFGDDKAPSKATYYSCKELYFKSVQPRECRRGSRRIKKSYKR